ncbi:hypothetical protein PNOK_0349900 [Pyrrhoderma noxium]|uniref:Uncharacterized protein n=1 Tax=Pyrrhoderma noxium TaxID=2282107 RepID=A0A286UMS6_9AGAM|nr:hypothetical protein PNOK_0349900 [Pyrrhoderma noxium]
MATKRPGSILHYLLSKYVTSTLNLSCQDCGAPAERRARQRETDPLNSSVEAPFGACTTPIECTFFYDKHPENEKKRGRRRKKHIG